MQLAPTLYPHAKSVTILARSIPLLMPVTKEWVVTGWGKWWRQVNADLVQSFIGYFDNRLELEHIFRSVMSSAVDYTSRSTKGLYVRDRPIFCSRVCMDYLGLGDLMANDRVRLVGMTKPLELIENAVIANGETIPTDCLIYATGYKEFVLDFPIHVDEQLKYDGHVARSFPISFQSMPYGVPNCFIPGIEPALGNVPARIVEGFFPNYLKIMQECDANGLTCEAKDHSDEYERALNANPYNHILTSKLCHSVRYVDRAYSKNGKVFTFENHVRRSVSYSKADYIFRSSLFRP